MMLLFRFMLLSLFAILLSRSPGYTLTSTLEELIAEKGIIMPDLASRYPDAEAVYILNEKQIDQSRIINPVYITRHVVIKILKEPAIEKFRTIKIPYFKEVKFTDFEARTINDGQIIKVKDIPDRDVDIETRDSDFIIPLEQANNMYAVRSLEINTNPNSGDVLKITESQIFHKKKEEAFKIREINFPEVKVGSVLEYYYRIEQKRIVLYDRFFFQQEYPVLKAIYKLRNAKMMHFNYQINNFRSKPKAVFEPRFTNLEEQYNQQIRHALRSRVAVDNPDSWQYFGHQYFEISLDTLDAYPEDLPCAPAYGDLCMRVDFFLRQANNIWELGSEDYRIRRKRFSPNWNYVMHRLAQKRQVKARLANKAKAEIASVIAAAATTEEKIAAAV